MLFRKKIPRSCSYCEYAATISENQVLCVKKGLKNTDKACRRFSYAPCKRIPVKAKTMDFSIYNKEDFSL